MYYFCDVAVFRVPPCPPPIGPSARDDRHDHLFVGLRPSPFFTPFTVECLSINLKKIKSKLELRA